MAGLEITLSNAAKVTTGTAAKTILQAVAPANHRGYVKDLTITFDGVTASDVPVLVELIRQTSAGTGGGAADSTLRNDGAAETAQFTGLKAPVGTWTAEPTTASTAVKKWLITPTAAFERVFDHREIAIQGGGRLALRITAAVAVNVLVEMGIEE